MPYSIRLTPTEERLLEAASKKSGQTKSGLVRRSIREVCLRLVEPSANAFEMGARLFGAGRLARKPRDSAKRALREKLDAKHGRLG